MKLLIVGCLSGVATVARGSRSAIVRPLASLTATTSQTNSGAAIGIDIGQLFVILGSPVP